MEMRQTKFEVLFVDVDLFSRLFSQVLFEMENEQCVSPCLVCEIFRLDLDEHAL